MCKKTTLLQKSLVYIYLNEEQLEIVEDNLDLLYHTTLEVMYHQGFYNFVEYLQEYRDHILNGYLEKFINISYKKYVSKFCKWLLKNYGYYIHKSDLIKITE